MKTHELRQLNREGLQRKVIDCMQEKFDLKVQKKAGRLKATHKVRDVRRMIARLYTLSCEKPR